MPSILVVGVLPHDSGKTTLATSLVREAVEGILEEILGMLGEGGL